MAAAAYFIEDSVSRDCGYFGAAVSDNIDHGERAPGLKRGRGGGTRRHGPARAVFSTRRSAACRRWRKRCCRSMSGGAWRRGSMNLHPFKTVSVNHDLVRALRLAWVEAACHVLDAAQPQAARDPEVARFAELARTELHGVRSAAFDRGAHPGDTAIDGHLHAVVQGVPEFVAAEPDKRARTHADAQLHRNAGRRDGLARAGGSDDLRTDCRGRAADPGRRSVASVRGCRLRRIRRAYQGPEEIPAGRRSLSYRDGQAGPRPRRGDAGGGAAVWTAGSTR